MRHLFIMFSFLLITTATQAQFQVSENGLTIIVTDGTEAGKNSEIVNQKNIPTSYDQVGKRIGKAGAKGKAGNNSIVFNDPIRSLGMTDCIQAAAFLERPEFGKMGFMLIFSINDSIGGKQATLVQNGKTYQGVYRLIRQKTSAEEAVPEGMTNYKVAGTFLLLGIS